MCSLSDNNQADDTDVEISNQLQTNLLIKLL